MAEKATQLPFEKYGGARVARHYAKDGDIGRAQIALQETPLDTDGQLLIDNDPHYQTDEGIKRASIIYGNQFDEGRRALTLGGLAGFYATQRSQVSEVERNELDALFEKHKDKKYGDIEDDFTDAAADLKDFKEGRLKRRLQKELGLKEKALEAELIKRVKKAKEIQEEYAPLIRVVSLYQEGREAPIVERTRIGVLERIARGEK